MAGKEEAKSKRKDEGRGQSRPLQCVREDLIISKRFESGQRNPCSKDKQRERNFCQRWSSTGKRSQEGCWESSQSVADKRIDENPTVLVPCMHPESVPGVPSALENIDTPQWGRQGSLHVEKQRPNQRCSVNIDISPRMAPKATSAHGNLPKWIRRTTSLSQSAVRLRVYQTLKNCCCLFWTTRSAQKENGRTRTGKVRCSPKGRRM